jgi:uncharacterized membrane protein
MTKLRTFLNTSIIGGFVVVLPVVILIFALKWIFGFALGIIRPLTNMIDTETLWQEVLANAIVIGIVLVVCFLVGAVVRTRLGGMLYSAFEGRILKTLPGYKMIKETVAHLIGNKKSPFSQAALVQIFGNETMVSAFITERYPDGSCTVFVPTGPNPTSGNIYHVKAKYVHPVNAATEDVMRTIISCGGGSTLLMDNCDECPLTEKEKN